MIEEKFKCEKCKGYGILYSHFKQSIIHCRYCYGDGEVDWLDHILRRPKHTSFVYPCTETIRIKQKQIGKVKGWRYIRSMTNLMLIQEEMMHFCIENRITEGTKKEKM